MELNKFFDSVFAERVMTDTITDSEKETIKEIYLRVKRVELQITCKNCFSDAYFLLFNLFKSNRKHFTALYNSEYRLKNGAILQEFGNVDNFMTSLNTTNELSEYYLRKDQAAIEKFSVYPSDWLQRIAPKQAVKSIIVTETVTENTDSIEPEPQETKIESEIPEKSKGKRGRPSKK